MYTTLPYLTLYCLTLHCVTLNYTHTYAVKLFWSKFGPFRGYYLAQVGLLSAPSLMFACFYSGFKWFLHTQLSFYVFWCPIIWQSFKKSIFQKKGCRHCFCFQISLFKFNFWKLSLLCLLNPCKTRGFSIFLCVLLLKEKKRQKIIIRISGFGFFGPKMAVSWRFLFSKNWFAETPISIVFWGCALFGPSCQKGKFWTPPQTREFWLITQKLVFCIFWVSVVFSSFSVLLFCFFVFLFCFCSVFLGSVLFRGGFKGQVRWPKGPPHLALNPPYFFGLFCFFFSFCFFEIKLFFPIKGALLLTLQCLPLFLPSFLFHFPSSLSLCLSLSLSLSLSLVFYFFLPSLFFLLYFACLFLSLCFFVLSLCFCFIKRTTSKNYFRKFLFFSPVSFLVFCLVLSFKSLFLIFVFSWY